VRDCVCLPFWPALEDEEQEEQEQAAYYGVAPFLIRFSDRNWRAVCTARELSGFGDTLSRRRRRRPPGLVPSF